MSDTPLCDQYELTLPDWKDKEIVDFARQLERELAVYKSTLELIRDHGGCTTTDEGLTCTGSWCGEQAKRALEGTK